MSISWFFPPTEPYRVQGRGLAEDNFAAEDRNSEEIMGREGYQNALDARARGNTAAVRVVMNVLSADQFNVDYLRSLITPEYLSRLEAATGVKADFDFSKSSVFVLEDFGTLGLEGDYANSDLDGERENWNAFWFREGEGAKAGPGSNGRAGQGKVTFYRIGNARAVLGFTIRHSDRKPLLMGRNLFRRNYSYDGRKYEREAFWCVTRDKQVLPTEDTSEIENFRQAFKLQREKEPGLSLVVPFPIVFDSMELVRTAISDFYLPIARGRLEVQIGEELINAANIDSKADHVLPDNLARERRSSFTKGFRSMVQRVLADERAGKRLIELKLGWEKGTSLSEASFPDGSLDELRAALDKGDRIDVRCPVIVKPKRGAPLQTWFDIHLEVPEELDKVEEAYIRRDLLIGSESHLRSSSYLPKARGLTLIADETMSAFLADAEEPTHLKWNASRPRLAEDYRSPKELVRTVRQALPRLLTLLTGGDAKRDVKALAKYFTKPAERGRKHDPGGREGGDNTTPTIVPPESQRKPLLLTTGINWVAVRPNNAAVTALNNLPFTCELELAYEGLDQNPFDSYDPFDFDLTDNTTFSRREKGISVTEVRNNEIAFEITNSDFELHISGFDPKIRLRARLTYKETENGKSLDT